MKRRGYILAWENRRWAGAIGGYQSGQADGNITYNGALPDFFTFEKRGEAQEYYDDELYTTEKLYISSAFKNDAGEIYRFGVLYKRDSYGSDTSRNYSFVIKCDEHGNFVNGTYKDHIEYTNIGQNNRRYPAFLLHTETTPLDVPWRIIDNYTPFINTNTYSMFMNGANEIYNKATSAQITGTTMALMFSFYNTNVTFNESFLSFQTSRPGNITTIINKARSLSSYKYWYGGAGQIATRALADQLKKDYPGIWTDSYYEKALNDIGKRIADCSYLVNYAYGKASPGNHGPATSEYAGLYSKWNGAPKDGMILWRSGHTGIYASGKVIEMRGIDYDYQESNYDSSKWSAIYYDRNINY